MLDPKGSVFFFKQLRSDCTKKELFYKGFTAWNVSKYGAFSGPYFPVFSPNTGKYGPEKTAYLDTFHAVFLVVNVNKSSENCGSVYIY